MKSFVLGLVAVCLLAVPAVAQPNYSSDLDDCYVTIAANGGTTYTAFFTDYSERVQALIDQWGLFSSCPYMSVLPGYKSTSDGFLSNHDNAMAAVWSAYDALEVGAMLEVDQTTWDGLLADFDAEIEDLQEVNSGGATLKADFEYDYNYPLLNNVEKLEAAEAYQGY